MIIFGLGNPGLKYWATRHNIGYIFLEQMARYYKKKFHSHSGYKIVQVEIAGKTVALIKPLAWMNQSGIAIKNILNKTHTVNNFLIVLDDVNLPLGKMRLRIKGSDGGHLGLRSIINSLNTNDFPRLRIGIGKPDEDVALYVLARFEKKEKKLLKETIEQGIKGIEILIEKGFESAQNYINAVKVET